MELALQRSELLTALALGATALALVWAAGRSGHARRARTALFALAYLVALLLGRSLTVPDTALALFWPAAGVGGLWLLGSTRGAQLQLDGLALFSTTVVALELVGLPTGSALLLGTANLVVAIAVRLVGDLSTSDRTPPSSPIHLRHVRDVGALGVASLAAGLASAPFGLAASALAGGEVDRVLAVAWVLRITTGAFLVMVVVLAVHDARDRLADGSGRRTLLASRPRPRLGLEAAIGLPLSVLVVVVVFLPREMIPLAFVALLASAYVGSRFSPLVSTLHTAVASVVAGAATWLQTGPFAYVSDPLQRANATQLFLLASASLALTFSMAARERHFLVERLATAEASTRQQSDLLRGVTFGVSEGLLVLAADGDVLVRNPAAHALLPERSIDAPGLGPLRVAQAHALATGGVATAELVRRDTWTGGERFLAVTADPITLQGGDLPSQLVVIRLQDVTEERARARTLESFVGVVAHDLRAPLTAITTWADLAEEDEPGAAAGGAGTTTGLALQQIRSSGREMHALIDDLLAYAVGSSATLVPEPVRLGPVLQEVADVVRAALPDGSLAPLVQVDATDTVLADRASVRRLLTNLVGNAVKYVAVGVTPYVRVSSRRLPDGRVEISVEDNGLGIPEEDRVRVFESFYRAPRDRERPGTGLGLAICAQVVERHDGRISAHAAPRTTGTLVVLDLPGAAEVA